MKPQHASLPLLQITLFTVLLTSRTINAQFPITQLTNSSYSPLDLLSAHLLPDTSVIVVYTSSEDYRELGLHPAVIPPSQYREKQGTYVVLRMFRKSGFVKWARVFQQFLIYTFDMSLDVDVSGNIYFYLQQVRFVALDYLFHKLSIDGHTIWTNWYSKLPKNTPGRCNGTYPHAKLKWTKPGHVVTFGSSYDQAKRRDRPYGYFYRSICATVLDANTGHFKVATRFKLHFRSEQSYEFAITANQDTACAFFYTVKTQYDYRNVAICFNHRTGKQHRYIILPDKAPQIHSYSSSIHYTSLWIEEPPITKGRCLKLYIAYERILYLSYPNIRFEYVIRTVCIWKRMREVAPVRIYEFPKRSDSFHVLKFNALKFLHRTKSLALAFAGVLQLNSSNQTKVLIKKGGKVIRVKLFGLFKEGKYPYPYRLDSYKYILFDKFEEKDAPSIVDLNRFRLPKPYNLFEPVDLEFTRNGRKVILVGMPYDCCDPCYDRYDCGRARNGYVFTEAVQIPR